MSLNYTKVSMQDAYCKAGLRLRQAQQRLCFLSTWITVDAQAYPPYGDIYNTLHGRETLGCL